MRQRTVVLDEEAVGLAGPAACDKDLRRLEFRDFEHGLTPQVLSRLRILEPTKLRNPYRIASSQEAHETARRTRFSSTKTPGHYPGLCRQSGVADLQAAVTTEPLIGLRQARMPRAAARVRRLQLYVARIRRDPFSPSQPLPSPLPIAGIA
jgi:hypothetical protein